MPGVILSSIVAVVLGMFGLIGGLIARHREHQVAWYLIGIGVVLVILGLAGFGYFISSFG